MIEKINQTMGWSLIHAEKGGEHKILNYFVDGFDKDLNIIFEYDEVRHFRKRHKLLKAKDLARMHDLINHTNATVIRYSELTNSFDVYNNQRRNLATYRRLALTLKAE